MSTKRDKSSDTLVLETMRLEEADGIARLTLTRPKEANTVSPQFARDLLDAATRLRDAGSARAVLLSAQGPVFCGGGDLKTFAVSGDAFPQTLRAMIEDLHGALEVLAGLDAPIVTAVAGSAGGAGLSLVAMSDIVYATEDAKFVVAYTGVGLSPDGGSTFFLPRIVGMRRAAELMLLNRPLTAEEALDWGLITKVVAPKCLSGEAEKTAKRLAAGPTRAFGQVRRLLQSSFSSDFADQLAREQAGIVAMAGTQDGVEGVAAFLEKRKPAFKGA